VNSLVEAVRRASSPSGSMTLSSERLFSAFWYSIHSLRSIDSLIRYIIDNPAPLADHFAPDARYAVEELAGELGAAFLCADLRITDEPRADHAQYLASWLSVLMANKKAIFTAASKASEAAAFLVALQGA
jgi:hypothetical protein